MNKRFSTYITAAVVSIVLYSCGAGYHLRQGNRLYSMLAYNSAITEYEKALSKKPLQEAKIKLAESYRNVNNMQKAETAYADVVQITGVKPEHKLEYAKVLMRNGKYPSAVIWLESYLKETPGDKGAQMLMESCNKIDEMKKDSAKYSLEAVNINTGQTNFSPIAYKDGIVFVSDRSTESAARKMYAWTGKPFLDLYYSKKDKTGSWSIPEALKGDVNGVYHEGPAAFGNDTTMYFTRDNYVKKKTKKDDEDVVKLKIYQSTWTAGGWSSLSEVPFNSNDYSTGHPALTKDGNTMYFVSDMPGGVGGTDIWMVKKEKGTWGNPMNMGTQINTPYNEMFPSVYHDSLLYFASQGHTNLGGLDVFYASKNGTGWSDPVNMGYPLNTSNDDFGILMNDSATGGLISSNRANSMQDNIYSFRVNDLRFTLKGLAVLKSTQAPLEGVVVELLNKTTGKRETMTTGPDGTFTFKLDHNSDFVVVGSKDNFFTNTESLTTMGKTVSEDMEVTLKLEMEQIIINKPIVLENIYYDLDKSDIRPDAAAGLDKLVNIMKDNPGISIELSSHTDSRADDKYNMSLSQRRAESAVAYIIAQGVAKERIKAKGYGESKLINRCKNDVKCTEEEHQQNRRTEFKVTSMGTNKPM
ncbi:MAG: OmpA family protein [Bacteroidetes bacterium]|nr:OmpA family protein [Bacteroidota bacterium]